MQYDKPQFTYELGEPGTAKASFAYHDVALDFELSNICNPLGDMLSGLVSLLASPSYLWGEEGMSHIEWYNDSDSFYWQLTLRNRETLNIRIVKSAGFFDEGETELLNADCVCNEFIYCIISELDTLIKRTGMLNYSQQWQKAEFPITYFLFLKKVLIDNGRWHPGSRKQCDILSDEVLLLLA